MTRLSSINGAIMRRRCEAVVKPSSVLLLEFLKVMQKHGFVGKFQSFDGHGGGRVEIELASKLKKCGFFSYRHHTTAKNIPFWTERLLSPRQVPRQVGYLVMTTSSGIMDHHEAQERNIGGAFVGFFC